MSPTPQSRRFLGLRIDFDDRILEPRPWTEMQSRWATELATDAPPGPILELCCGAGQIGLAAAVSSGRPLHQVDIDPVACGYARHNAAVAGVDATVWCAELDADVLPESRYRIIIADPPYLDPNEALLYPSDPALAVNGGPDGLELVRRCLAVIACRLDPDGTALLQLRGARQIQAVDHHITNSELPLRAAGDRRAGPDRAVLAVRFARYSGRRDVPPRRRPGRGAVDAA